VEATFNHPVGAVGSNVVCSQHIQVMAAIQCSVKEAFQ